MPGTPALLGQDRGAGCYLHSLGCHGSKEDSGDAGNGQSLRPPQTPRSRGHKRGRTFLPYTKLHKKTADCTLHPPPFSSILRRPPTPNPITAVPRPQTLPLVKSVHFLQ